MYDNRKFMILSTSETGSIDFNEVIQTSPETLRLSLDGSQTFVKWDGELIPDSVNALITKEGPYTYSQIITILTGSSWASD